MNDLYVLYSIFIVAAIYLVRKVFIRLRLSRAKHPSLRGHSKWSRRIAKIIPYFEYHADVFYRTDGAPNDVAEQRREAFSTLKNKIATQSKKTLAHSESIEESVSDVRFTSHYRIPFPYRGELTKEFKLGSMVDETRGTMIKDIDGNWRYDVSGSYGVNTFGYDFYKSCMDVGFEKVKALGPALGSYHPLITDNVEMIKEVSGLDEVSFHMSGTEAVMQAVRLARYHTGKTHLVRFCGAYHGWWDGVQPGVGNKRQVNDVYTLADLSETALQVLDTRKDIACVLINPLQAFHPNSDSASDVTLIASDRATNFDKDRYSMWLAQIKEVCNRRNIVLIFDEVFTGFRLSHRGAQGYFGVQADMVTYGKTLGGGLPVGVLTGRADLMKRFRDNKPVDVSFARGTFNSHPYVLGAMNEFLHRIKQPEIQQQYQQLDQVWDSRVAAFNQRMEAESLPIRLTNMHTILSVLYTQPCRYNWMLQFYLRANGIELSWIGSGRMIMSFNFTDDDFDEVTHCFVAAAAQMKSDGWWWHAPHITNKAIKRQFLTDMLVSRFPWLSPVLSNPLMDDNAQSGVELTQSQNKNNVEKVS